MSGGRGASFPGRPDLADPSSLRYAGINSGGLAGGSRTGNGRVFAGFGMTVSAWATRRCMRLSCVASGYAGMNCRGGPSLLRYAGASPSMLRYAVASLGRGMLTVRGGKGDPASLSYAGASPSTLRYAGASITTTEIYLHVAVGVNGLGVESPLDAAA